MSRVWGGGSGGRADTCLRCSGAAASESPGRPVWRPQAQGRRSESLAPVVAGIDGVGENECTLRPNAAAARRAVRASVRVRRAGAGAVGPPWIAAAPLYRTASPHHADGETLRGETVSEP